LSDILAKVANQLLKKVEQLREDAFPAGGFTDENQQGFIHIDFCFADIYEIFDNQFRHGASRKG
jgi:hypothetical protein